MLEKVKSMLESDDHRANRTACDFIQNFNDTEDFAYIQATLAAGVLPSLIKLLQPDMPPKVQVRSKACAYYSCSRSCEALGFISISFHLSCSMLFQIDVMTALNNLILGESRLQLLQPDFGLLNALSLCTKNDRVEVIREAAQVICSLVDRDIEPEVEWDLVKITVDILIPLIDPKNDAEVLDFSCEAMCHLSGCGQEVALAGQNPEWHSQVQLTAGKALRSNLTGILSSNHSVDVKTNVVQILSNCTIGDSELKKVGE